MPKTIPPLRLKAYRHQAGRCWYCGVQMWQLSPTELPGTSPGQAAALLQCTAEHLLARCDGGRDVDTNIVAACLRRNRTRHQKKRPPAPATYRKEVRKRVGRGAWHHSWVKASGLL